MRFQAPCDEGRYVEEEKEEIPDRLKGFPEWPTTHAYDARKRVCVNAQRLR